MMLFSLQSKALAIVTAYSILLTSCGGPADETADKRTTPSVAVTAPAVKASDPSAPVDAKTAAALAKIDALLAQFDAAKAKDELSLRNATQDRDAVNAASMACIACAVNALWTAAALYGAPAPIGSGKDVIGLLANASGPVGIIMGALGGLTSGENMTTAQVITLMNAVVQGILLAIRQEMISAGPAAVLGKLQGLANLISTLATCGIAITQGAVLLWETTGAAITEVREALAYDVATPVVNDSAAVAQGRQCVANVSFWSATSYFEQCRGCCLDAARLNTFPPTQLSSCMAPCNAADL